LLTAKAYLLSGRPDRAQKIFQQHPVFEKGELTDEVLGLWNHVLKANEKVELANKLNDEKKWEEANKAWHEATGLYPQSEAFKMGAEVQDVVVEFEKKDYDRLLSLSEGLWKRHAESSMASGMFASALACKFAVTGDPEFKRKSEEQLEKSRTLAQGSPEETKQFDEYAERIRYRLSSREIIDTDEYNRRFRATPAVRKGN
jgi:hypothetical protein